MRTHKFIKLTRGLGLMAGDLLADRTVRHARSLRAEWGRSDWSIRRSRRHPILATVGFLVVGAVALSILLTVLGLMLALVAVALKVALVIGAIVLAVRFIRGRREDRGQVVPFDQRPTRYR